MAVRTKRLSEKKVKAQESGVYSDVAPTSVHGEVMTPERKEECTKQRIHRGFISNKLRLENLISDDCLLSDVDTVMMPIPAVDNVQPPLVAYLKATDRRHIEVKESDVLDDLEKQRFSEGYEAGASQATKEMRKLVGNEALLKYAEAAQRVIHMLLKTHEDRVNFMDTITPEELASRIAFYFDECDKRKRSYTVPGLAFEIGFMQRQDMFDFLKANYQTLNGYMLARALTKIEDQRNTEIISGGGVMAGHKLDLATNFSWNDAGKKDSAPAQVNNTTINQTNNTLNVTPESLPPTLTLDQWQAQFLDTERKKGSKVDAEVTDVEVIGKGKKKG
jgi:hypothetical protein